MWFIVAFCMLLEERMLLKPQSDTYRKVIQCSHCLQNASAKLTHEGAQDLKVCSLILSARNVSHLFLGVQDINLLKQEVHINII
jgi:hypothetical protein